MRPLEGKVAVVAGATRGAGRAIACTLGEAGAVVYCTGRSVRGQPSSTGRPETIEETAEMAAARGGTAIPVQTDHTDREQVRRLFERVGAEQGGRLDVLVNNVNGDDLVKWSTPFWEQSLDDGLRTIERGVHSHIITTHAALPLMLRAGRGLVVGVTDRGSVSFFHGFMKQSVMKLAELLAPELRPHGIAAVALTPGYLRSEVMLELFGVTEANWRDGVKKDPYFAGSETPYYTGRAVAALAADPRVLLKSGRTLASWEVAEEYGFTDVDGARPHWDRFMAPAVDEHWATIAARVRAEFARHGADADAVLDLDRASTTLRARLSPTGEEPRRWYAETLNMADVIYGDPQKLAADFHARWALGQEASAPPPESVAGTV
jgi:NAD(P)-dependent dehydrogenase (short-subunit alcohol dehydrogenase family)